MINAFGSNPNIAALHEVQIALVMHAKLGLNGALPKGGQPAPDNSIEKLVPQIPSEWTTSAEIARIFGRTRDSMTATLAKLQARGLISRRRRPGASQTEWKAIPDTYIGKNTGAKIKIEEVG